LASYKPFAVTNQSVWNTLLQYALFYVSVKSITTKAAVLNGLPFLG